MKKTIPIKSPIKKKTEKKTKPIESSPRKEKKDSEVKLALATVSEKENEKTEKRSDRKRKRERKEEVIVHGPQPVVAITGNNDKNEKKIDSLSQIISESDSEGKEQGFKFIKIQSIKQIDF